MGLPNYTRRLQVRVSVGEPRHQTRDDAHRAKPQGSLTPIGGQGILDVKDDDDGHGEGQAVACNGHIHGYVATATDRVDAKQKRPRQKSCCDSAQVKGAVALPGVHTRPIRSSIPAYVVAQITQMTAGLVSGALMSVLRHLLSAAIQPPASSSRCAPPVASIPMRHPTPTC